MGQEPKTPAPNLPSAPHADYYTGDNHGHKVIENVDECQTLRTFLEGVVDEHGGQNKAISRSKTPTMIPSRIVSPPYHNMILAIP